MIVADLREDDWSAKKRAVDPEADRPSLVELQTGIELRSFEVPLRNRVQVDEGTGINFGRLHFDSAVGVAIVTGPAHSRESRIEVAIAIEIGD